MSGRSIPSGIAGIALGAAALGSLGCSYLSARTTVAAASGPIPAAPDDAIVVLYRPSAFGVAGPVSALPAAERWSIVRILDEHGDPVGDLHATEHTQIRLPPGHHELFAMPWGGATHRECIGAMRADLAAGHVYGARVYSFGHVGSRKHGCARLDIVAVARDERATFDGELERSQRVVFLGAHRDHSRLVDDLDVRLATVAQGRLRMTDDPAWPGPRSLLAPEDGLDAPSR